MVTGFDATLDQGGIAGRAGRLEAVADLAARAESSIVPFLSLVRGRSLDV